MKTVTYEWSWDCLSLFRNFKEGAGGGSSRVFTLKPSWMWQYWQHWVMVKLGKWPPDPFEMCERWLRRNSLWHLEGPAFLNAINRYAASCEPGHYVNLNPKLLK